jgi:hypothetical protein
MAQDGITTKAVRALHARAIGEVEKVAPLVARSVSAFLDEALAEVSCLELNADVLADIDDDRLYSTGGN